MLPQQISVTLPAAGGNNWPSNSLMRLHGFPKPTNRPLRTIGVEDRNDSLAEGSPRRSSRSARPASTTPLKSAVGRSRNCVCRMGKAPCAEFSVKAPTVVKLGRAVDPLTRPRPLFLAKLLDHPDDLVREVGLLQGAAAGHPDRPECGHAATDTSQTEAPDEPRPAVQESGKGACRGQKSGVM